jgi:hypothetical protein
MQKYAHIKKSYSNNRTHASHLVIVNETKLTLTLYWLGASRLARRVHHDACESCF